MSQIKTNLMQHCSFYFCRVTPHVSGASAHHQYLKLVQRPLVHVLSLQVSHHITLLGPELNASSGEPLISTRPFAVSKWSAWLVSKDPPISEAPRIVILNLLQCCIPPSCGRLLTMQHTKSLELQNPLFPIIWVD